LDLWFNAGVAIKSTFRLFSRQGKALALAALERVGTVEQAYKQRALLFSNQQRVAIAVLYKVLSVSQRVIAPLLEKSGFVFIWLSLANPYLLSPQIG